MKYAVVSDVHDNFYNLQEAIGIIKRRGIKTCFYLGDFCAPSISKAMVAHKDLRWICIWGNVDGAKAQIVLEQWENPNFDIVAETFREVETPKGKVFLSHFPLPAKVAAKSGEYVAVFHGHTHEKKVEKLENGTLLANPGEIGGFVTGQPSFAIWDLDVDEFEIVDLRDFRVAK